MSKYSIRIFIDYLMQIKFLVSFSYFCSVGMIPISAYHARFIWQEHKVT